MFGWGMSAERAAPSADVLYDDLSGDGGVRKRIVRAGMGDPPPVGAKCKIHFKAML